MFKHLGLALLILLLPLSEAYSGKNKEKLSTKEVGYAACKGLVSYGGQTFAIWLAGTNPAGATILLVGLTGSAITGYGFDKITHYLTRQGIAPPKETHIEVPSLSIDDFVVMDLNEEDEELEANLIAPSEQELILESTTYSIITQKLYSLAETNMPEIPRVSLSLVSGFLASTLFQLIGPEILASIVNASTANITDQTIQIIESSNNSTHTTTEDGATTTTHTYFNEENDPPEVSFEANFLQTTIFTDYPRRNSSTTLEDYCSYK